MALRPFQQLRSPLDIAPLPHCPIGNVNSFARSSWPRTLQCLSWQHAQALLPHPMSSCPAATQASSPLRLHLSSQPSTSAGHFSVGPEAVTCIQSYTNALHPQPQRYDRGQPPPPSPPPTTLISNLPNATTFSSNLLPEQILLLSIPYLH